MFNLSKFQSAYAAPIGTILAFPPGYNPNWRYPEGNYVWYPCGTTFSKRDFPELFDIIGDTNPDPNFTHFNSPDLTDRVVVGVGRVDGNNSESPYIGNTSNERVGLTGGSDFLEGIDFTSEEYVRVGDITTTGWENVITQVDAKIDGEWKITFGPLEGQTLRGVPLHNHNILTTEVNDDQPFHKSFDKMDPWAVCYNTVPAFMESFEPNGPSPGIPFDHSHALAKGIRQGEISVGNAQGIAAEDSDGRYIFAKRETLTVNGFSLSGNKLTITFSSSHGIRVNERIFVSGFNQDSYNGVHVVTELESASLTFVVNDDNPPIPTASAVNVQQVSQYTVDEVRSETVTGTFVRTLTERYRDVFFFDSSRTKFDNPTQPARPNERSGGTVYRRRIEVDPNFTNFGEHSLTKRDGDEAQEVGDNTNIRVSSPDYRIPLDQKGVYKPLGPNGEDIGLPDVSDYLRIAGSSITVGPFPSTISKISIIFGIGTSAEKKYHPVLDSKDNRLLIEGEEPFARGIQHREELYLRIKNSANGDLVWGADYYNPNTGTIIQEVKEYDTKNNEITFEFATYSEDDDNPEYTNPADRRRTGDIFSFGSFSDFFRKGTTAFPVSFNALEKKIKDQGLLWEVSDLDLPSGVMYDLEFGREGGKGPDVYGIFAISVGYSRIETETIEFTRTRVENFQTNQISTQTQSPLNTVKSNAANESESANGPDVVRYTYKPRDINLSLSTGTVTMNSFNNFDFIPTVFNKDQPMALFNKYRNVKYWIKAR